MTIQLFKKMGAAFSVLVMASALTACGNNSNNSGSNCGTGEIEAAIGGADAQCYTTCEADATVCAAGKECKSVGGKKLCMDASTTNNTTGGTTNQCAAGTVQATFMGEAKCWTSCTDGAECAATDECRLVGQVRICTPRECPVGNVKATYQGVEKCYKTCGVPADCDAAAGEECVTSAANKICAVPPPSQFKDACEKAAKAWFGECATAKCDAATAGQLNQFENPFLQGANGQPGCEDQAEADEGFAALVETYAAGYTRGGCDDGIVKHGLCYFVPGFTGANGIFETQCGCEEPNIGGACANDDECPQALGSGSCDTESPGGQCGYSCLPFNLDIQGPTLFEGEASGCTTEGVCVAIPQGNQIQAFCLEDCQTNADCERGVTGADDAGYACTALLGIQGGGYQGACFEACVAGEMCDPIDNNGTMIPRTCGPTRTCENNCDPNAAMNPSCRTGETCVALANDPTKGTCHNPGLDGAAP